MNQNTGTFCWKDCTIIFFSGRIVIDVAIYTCMCIVWLDMKIPVYICDWHSPHFILLPVIRIYLPLVVVSDEKSCLLLEASCGRNLFVIVTPVYLFICYLCQMLKCCLIKKSKQRKMCRVHLYFSRVIWIC